MKRVALIHALFAVVAVGCSSEGGPGSSSGSSATVSGGIPGDAATSSGQSSGLASTSGQNSGTSSGSSGVAASGQSSGTSGASGTSSGASGSATGGQSGSGTSSGLSSGSSGTSGKGDGGVPYKKQSCPARSFPAPMGTNRQTVCAGFKYNHDFHEGPVWIASQNAFFFSNFEHFSANAAASNFNGDIIKFTPSTWQCEVFIKDACANGLCVSPDGNLLPTSHLTRTITEFD